MNITEIILDEREKLLARMRKEGFWSFEYSEKRYDAIPWDINNGYCEEFAIDVMNRIGGKDTDIEGLWLEELGYDYREYDHFIIRYQGKYYDAECPEGVESVEQLPFFLNKGKPRG